MKNDELKEQLSALVDDELKKDEALFLCRRLANSPEAVEQLGRYFLISDALRRQLPDSVDLRLADRVTAALAQEAELQVSNGTWGRRLARPLTGLGIAASVAMVAVSMWSADGPAPEGLAATPQVAASPVQPVALGSPVQQWDRLDPEVQAKLNGYLVNHSEHSSTGRFGGMLNYVRIAGQQDRD